MRPEVAADAQEWREREGVAVLNPAWLLKVLREQTRSGRLGKTGSRSGLPEGDNLDADFIVRGLIV
jgi:hypothetical protein